jgi:hypothetical protein
VSVHLVITSDVVAEASRVREFAERTENRRAGEVSPGDLEAHRMCIPMGFRVVFSVDAGSEPGLWFRHLSVSVEATRGHTVPSRAAMQEIASLFGFTPEARFGTLAPDPPYVIHAIESFTEH